MGVVRRAAVFWSAEKVLQRSSDQEQRSEGRVHHLALLVHDEHDELLTES